MVTEGPRDLGPLACVHHAIEEQTTRTPTAVAARFEGDALAYAELNARANRLAWRLIEAGVGPDVLVGLLVDRSLDMVVGLLGILKSGGAYVPLDPAYPAARLAFMLEDSRPAVVVTQERLRDALPPHPSRVEFVDEQSLGGRGETSDDPHTAVGLEHLAYVIYTSGFTGNPKGVMIEHRSLAHVLSSMRRTLAFGPRDVVLAVSTLSFDVACMDVCLPLMVGAHVVVVGDEDAMFGGRIAHHVGESGATFLEGTPSMWRMLVDAGWRGSSGLQMLATGERLPESLAESLLGRGARLWNGYGATEAGIYATLHDVQRGQSPIPVGRPLLETVVRILDDDRREPPEGETGEIHIGGPTLARGYLNRPELTAERFVPDPSSALPGARLYRTGDLGRRRPDGALEYLGRKDHQVKLRGFRIELEEIERTLARHEAVREAVAAVQTNGRERSQLVAYVVLAGGESLHPRVLRRYLQDTLPLYMVPATVVLLESLPRTPNGKLDRLGLPPLGPGA